MSDYSKKEFLDDVKYEVTMIKRHATEAEIHNLSFYTFDGSRTDRCIYGQLTGNCYSDRATELIKVCARAFFKSMAFSIAANNTHVSDFEKLQMSKHTTGFNDENQRKAWSGVFSALEVFIRMGGADREGIISWLRGWSENLVLLKEQE